MRNRSALFAAGLAAALVLAATAGTAGANRLSLNETNFALTWDNLTWTSAIGDVECEIELTGSFAGSTFEKVAESTIGSITGGTVVECSGGSLELLTETPWTVRFKMFHGLLPEISGLTLTIEGTAMRYETLVTCLFTTSAANRLEVTASVDTSTGVIDATTTTGTLDIDLEGEFFCEVAGDSSFGETTGTLEGATEPLALALV